LVRGWLARCQTTSPTSTRCSVSWALSGLADDSLPRWWRLAPLGHHARRCHCWYHDGRAYGHWHSA
jgi:hypothetical protein